MGIPKSYLRRLRHWSKFHTNTTVFEAFSYLQNVPAFTEERQKLHDIFVSGPEIATFLIYTCGFKRTRKTKMINGASYVIYVRNEPGILDTRARENYVSLLTSIYQKQ